MTATVNAEMNGGASSEGSVSRWRRICATIFSAVAALFTGLWLLLCAFVFLQIMTGVYEGGELVFAGIFLTAPPVLLSTVLALLFVGPRRCKVAWISGLLYLSPPIVCGIIAAIASVFGLFKR